MCAVFNLKCATLCCSMHAEAIGQLESGSFSSVRHLSYVTLSSPSERELQWSKKMFQLFPSARVCLLQWGWFKAAMCRADSSTEEHCVLLHAARRGPMWEEHANKRKPCFCGMHGQMARLLRGEKTRETREIAAKRADDPSTSQTWSHPRPDPSRGSRPTAHKPPEPPPLINFCHTDLTLIPGATNVLSSAQPRVESRF